MDRENAKLKSELAGMHMNASQKDLQIVLLSNKVVRLEAELTLLKTAIKVNQK